MASDLTPEQEKLIVQAQNLADNMRYALTQIEGGTWISSVAMLASISADIERLLARLDTVDLPFNYVMPQRKEGQ